MSKSGKDGGIVDRAKGLYNVCVGESKVGPVSRIVSVSFSSNNIQQLRCRHGEGR